MPWCHGFSLASPSPGDVRRGKPVSHWTDVTRCYQVRKDSEHDSTMKINFNEYCYINDGIFRQNPHCSFIYCI